MNQETSNVKSAAAVASAWLGGVGKVICVDDSNIVHDCPSGPVVKGHTYHVTAVRNTGGLYILGKPVFLDGEEVAWLPNRFKKVGRIAS